MRLTRRELQQNGSSDLHDKNNKTPKVTDTPKNILNDVKPSPKPTVTTATAHSRHCKITCWALRSEASCWRNFSEGILIPGEVGC